MGKTSEEKLVSSLETISHHLDDIGNQLRIANIVAIEKLDDERFDELQKSSQEVSEFIRSYVKPMEA